jgi:sugar phosphate permease
MKENKSVIRPSDWVYRIFWATWIAEAGFYFCRRNISGTPLSHRITQTSWFWSFANVIFFFSAGYALGNVTGGWLADRIGARKALLAGGILSAASTALIAASPSEAMVVGLQFLNGFGQGFGWPSINKLFGLWLEPRQAPITIALWSTSYTLGGYLGASLPTVLALLRLFGSRSNHALLFLAPALLLLATSFLYYSRVRDTPEEAGLHLPPLVTHYSGNREEEARESWNTIVGNREIQLLACVYFFLKMTRYALLFWLPIYLLEIHRGSRQISLTPASLFETAGFLGNLVTAYLVQRTGKLYQVCAAMLFVAVFALLLQPVAGLLGPYFSAGFIVLFGISIYGPDMLLTSVAILRVVHPPRSEGRADSSMARGQWDRCSRRFSFSASPTSLAGTAYSTCSPSHLSSRPASLPSAGIPRKFPATQPFRRIHPRPKPISDQAPYIRTAQVNGPVKGVCRGGEGKGVQTAICCPCGNEKILALGLCATCG